MDTTNIGYYIIISINLLGFLIYLPTLKFVLKKSVPFRRVVEYVIVFMILVEIFLVIFTFIWNPSYFSNYPLVTIIIAIIVEFFVLIIGLLIFDGIIWYIAKWLYNLTRKKPQVESQM